MEIPCVFEKCDAKVLKSKLAQHLQSECSQRQVECDYCCQEMPFADLKVLAFDKPVLFNISMLIGSHS